MKKRVVIEVTKEEHQMIKFAAVKRNLSITKFVLQAIFSRLKDEKI